MEPTVSIGSPGVTIPPFTSVLEQASKNEQKGYDSIWWPDHLMGWFPQSIWSSELSPIAYVMPSPHTFLETMTTVAAVAARTERIRIGIGVTDPIRRHPAVLAQTFLTLDHISKGRMILGLGAGEAENIVPYGLNYDHPVERFEEAMKIIRLFWSSRGKTIDFEGRFWRLKDAVLELDPYGGRYPELWVGAHGARMMKIAGEYADGWLPVYMPLEEYREKLSKVRGWAAKAGRLEKITPAMWAETIIDEDAGECERIIDAPLLRLLALIRPSYVFERLGFKHPLGAGVKPFRDYIPSRIMQAQANDAMRGVPKEVCKECFLYGTPQQITEKIERYREVGLRHIVLWNYTFFADPSKLRSSFKSLEKVLQHFKT